MISSSDSGTTPAVNPQAGPPSLGKSLYGKLPSLPTRGFIGRDAERMEVSQALSLSGKTKVILLSGAEGVGKTALAVQVAHDLVDNERFAQSIYVSFAGGGNVEAALYELGSVLVSESFDANGDGKLTIIQQRLAQSPTLVIWDHLEALLTDGDAPISDQLFRNLVQQGIELVKDTDSRLILITDKALPYFTISQGILILPELQALSAEDALKLVISVAPETLSLDDRQIVVQISGFQPIAINVLAALLHHFSLQQVNDLIDRATPGARSAGIWGSLNVNDIVLGACWQTLAESAQEALNGLGIFAVGGMERLISQLEGLDAESWRRFQTLTLQAGLITREQVEPLAIPYLRIHPTLLHYALRHLTRETRSHLHAWYCASYLALLKWIGEHEQRMGTSLHFLVWRELPNFRRAFGLLIASQQLSFIQEYSQVFGYLIHPFGLLEEIEAIAEVMQTLMQSALPKEGPLSRPGVLFVLDQIRKMIDANKAADALTIIKSICQRIEKDDQLTYQGEEAKQDRAHADHLLGKALMATGANQLALGALLRSLKSYDELASKGAIKTDLLALLCDLTQVITTAHEYVRAGYIGERALLLATELHDTETLGRMNYELAIIYYNQRNKDRTRQYANSALEFFEADQNFGGQAEVWRLLATLSMQDNNSADAIHQLQQALELARQADIPQMVADTLVRLAQVEVRENHLTEAETCFMQALALFQENNARPSQATTEVALAELLLKEGQIANARSHAEAARALAEGMGSIAQPWVIFDLLERIAIAEEDPERALAWRRRARESLAESPQADAIITRWRPLLVKLAAVCEGQVLDDVTLAELEKMETEAENPELFAAIWSILGGERGSALYESLGMAQAVLVKRLLDGIGHPELLAEPASLDTSDVNQQAQPEFTIDQFVTTVKAALNGDQQAKAVTETFLQALSSEQAPQTLHDFANATRRILAGDTNPSVVMGLPPELAQVLASLMAIVDGNKLQ